MRRHLQDEGDCPRRIVMDLWASPTLRSGGEDIAHALALMGVRPTWDHASTRVTGFEIMPAAAARPSPHRRDGAHLGRVPRHLSGPDRPSRPRRPRRRRRSTRTTNGTRSRPRGGAANPSPASSAARPARFGAGVADPGARRRLVDRGATSAAPTSRARRTPSARASAAEADPSFPRRVAEADAFVHVTDVAERDLLDGDSTADAIGGFAAAAECFGRAPSLYSLDTSRPDAPKARTLREDIARLVHGRLVNPRWIDGAVAPRLARRGGAGAGRRCAVRFRCDHASRDGRAVRRRVTPRYLAADAVRERLFCRQSRPPARPSATGSPTRAGAAFGTAASTRSRRTSANRIFRGRPPNDRAATPRCGAAGAPACCAPCRPATACWCACIRAAAR